MNSRDVKNGDNAPPTSSSTAGLNSPRAASRPGSRVRWARLAYALLASGFVVCLVVQIFLAGMAIFESAEWWRSHTQFVHIFELVPLVMLPLTFIGRLSRGSRWLTGVAFLLLVLQYAFINVGRDLTIPIVSAFHVVNAPLIFWVAITLARGALRALSENRDAVQ